MIKSFNESLKTVEGFMHSHKRRAKTAEGKLKEAEEELKKKNDKLRMKKEQIFLLRDNLARAEIEL